MWVDAAAKCYASQVVRLVRNFDEAMGPSFLLSYTGLDQGLSLDCRFVIALSCRLSVVLRKDMYMFAAMCAINFAADGLRMINTSVAQQYFLGHSA